MITRLDEWNPEGATAANIERLSLMGPLCRLNIFGHEWPTISESYFGDLDRKGRADVESSTASLRGTLKSLQVRFGRFQGVRFSLRLLHLEFVIPGFQHLSSGKSRIKGSCLTVLCPGYQLECQTSGAASR